MSEFHEIEFLSKLARPEVVAITLIGESHMKQLGSKEGIAKAKLEILSGLQENGTFIYPAHEDLITAGIAQAETSKLQHRYSRRRKQGTLST